MSDDELDKLFKEAADGFKAPPDPTDWKHMAARLDQASPVTSFWNWKTVSTIGVVGVTSVALMWWSLRNDSDSSIQKDISNQGVESTTSKTVRPSIEKPAELNAASDQKTQENLASTSLQARKASEDNKQNIRLENEKQPVQVSTPPDQLPNKSKSIKKEVHDSQVDRVNAQELSDLPAVAAAPAVMATEPPTTDRDAPSPHETNSLTSSDSLEVPVVETKVAVSDSVAEAKEEASPEPIQKNGARVSIKVAVAPDFSSIKFFTPDDPGFNYGVMIGYSFNNRWSLYTGAISSRKIYTSTEIEEPYTTSGGHDYEINQLDGDCRVLDIPLNVYYNFFPERSFSVKAGIGFSSYLMFEEKYTYYVDNPYGSDIYHQRVVRENNEWFKMLNVSVILQKKLNNHFYFELEPFLKAPLAGVGEGEVSLVSLGAFFNVRFDIPIHKP